MPADRDPQMLKGVLPLLVLASLAHAESYGYELVVRLREDGLTDLSTGTLYPVLTRLERDRLISSRLVASPSGPARKYYLPTDEGRTALTDRSAAWTQLVSASRTVLGRVPTGDLRLTDHEGDPR